MEEQSENISKTENKIKIKRLTFRVSDDVHKKIKLLTVYNNQNMQDYLEQVVIEKLAEYELKRPEFFNI